ncbi:hypothetical protein D9B36_05650 [Corynebacterium diphtheriae]|nr:hypothetical protein D9B36_05650 [Corynebacterium diphtheriae]
MALMNRRVFYGEVHVTVDTATMEFDITGWGDGDGGEGGYACVDGFVHGVLLMGDGGGAGEGESWFSSTLNSRLIPRKD